MPPTVTSPREREPLAAAQAAAGTISRSVAGPAPAADGRWRVDGLYLARGNTKRLPRGVTYGPFPPNSAGEPFPESHQVAADFDAMRRFGVDAVRTYCPPPAWFLDLATRSGVAVLADIPWAKHLCFLDSPKAQAEARDAVRQAARAGRNLPCILGYSIGNEIPADVVRWHGEKRVASFLETLADTVRQVDPTALVTYANFPPTEYLDLPFLDFATYNVYLHDLETFRRYLLRLQNIAGDRPLVLGELGIDTLRHGEDTQARFLSGHLREASLLGVAGTFVFSWTDLWHTGGHLVNDWAFGVTRADRSPKAACQALETLAATPAADLLEARPRVSVVVCSYNGDRTLAQCLDSLGRLEYPDYEVILVDDGSTDDTPTIAGRFPNIRFIRHAANRGLSAARNTGLLAATGEIVAYTDSDCFADRDWLTHLVHRLESTGAHAVGGPNLSPEDGWLAACISASPGQPTHVLESDQVAEHVPGCNMAFRRGPLEAINALVWRPAGVVALVMLALSLLVACLQAAQARLPKRHRGLLARATIAALSYSQPLVRSFAHYRTRLSSYSAIEAHPVEHRVRRRWNPWRGHDDTTWWAEGGGDRTRLVADAVGELRTDGWGVTLDTGWSDWDAEVFGHPWTRLRVTTVQEEHGSGRSLVRLRSQLKFTWIAWTALAAAATTIVLAATWSLGLAALLAAITVLSAVGIHRRGVRLAAQIADAFDEAARHLGYAPCPTGGRGRPS